MGSRSNRGEPRSARRIRRRASSPVRAALALTLALCATAATSQALAAKGSTAVKDKAHLTLVKGARTSGPLREQGKATGTIPGAIHASITLNAATAKTTFTVYAKGGTLRGSGSGALKYGKGGYDSFGGTARITGGTGRFANARGAGHVYGSIDRINYHLSVQVDGTLHY